ncbi:MAG TPA: tryptophan synthase subunit alpha [Planctomycetota bacterium]|nr:tryptophan synthase subunit alpha [Planctomycetota bacterium]
MTLSDLRAALAAAPHHLSPFVMLGDPTPACSLQLARAAVAAGASMLELGIPYSDPCADGTAIQAACLRARAAGVSTAAAFALLAAIGRACPGVPCNLLVYGNLVHRRGLARFCGEARAAGASSLLVPDVPLGEDGQLRTAVAAAGLGAVALVGPRSAPARIAAAGAPEFVYVAGLQGVTGAAAPSVGERAALLQRVRAHTGAPLALGFGLQRGADVAAAFAAGAAIAVVGSQLARVIGACWAAAPGDEANVTAAFAAAVRSLLPTSAADVAARGGASCS